MIDIQNEKDIRDIRLNFVGISDYVIPIYFNGYNCTATISLQVSLEKNERAIHMSRLIEILNDWNGILDEKNLYSLLEQSVHKLHSKDAKIKISFMSFEKKKSPVTLKSGIVSYPIDIEANYVNYMNNLSVSIDIPISSTCPCSKAISENGAHNQRGNINLKINNFKINDLSLIIRKIEKCGSMELYSLLKREDEKYVTENSYAYAKFVEDIARDCVKAIKDDYDQIYIEVKNFESIHFHNAIANYEVS